MLLQPIYQFHDQFRHNHVDGQRQEDKNVILSEELQIFPIKTAGIDQKIKVVMLATSDATFPVLLATRFVSQVSDVTDAQLSKCICRIRKQNFVNNIKSTSGDLQKNSKYYFSHENGVKAQDHLLQTCLGPATQTQTND